jgi:4-diphosphocytidyl-2-C-methyl-D-erythritol kinase
MAGVLELWSSAKVNLFLKVTGQRADGYHELVSLMCGISLRDRIVLRPGTETISVSCDYPGVPADNTNLAARAAELFYARCPRDERVAIEIDKQIPVGAGLGGGSSNAATVLSGLNAHYGLPLSAEELHELGLSIGADVPFFLFGRPGLATGIGEQLTAYQGLTGCPLLVIYPGFSIPTAAVYKKLNLGLTKCQNHLKSFFLKQNGFLPAHHLCNDLETVVIPQYPEIAAAKKRLLENGAEGALMSGSGSSVFGIFADSQDARQAAEALGPQYGGAVFLADLLV